MKDKLTKEEVLHVSRLARVGISEEEIEKYQVELKKLLDEVDKIKEVKNYDEELLIAPYDHDTVLRKDESGEMLSNEEIMKNVPASIGNFVEVPVMIND